MDTNAKTIFISGPISGNDDAFDIFRKAEDELYDVKGYRYGDTKVINPASIALVLPDGLPWQAYMDMFLPVLKYCDAIYSLKGWKYSPGAVIERIYAERLGLEVIEQEDESDAD